MPNLSFRRAGNGAALVLVHGYLGGSAMWAAQMARFSPFRDVICPDLAGFGDSAALTAPAGIEAHAQDVLALLDGLEVEKFDLLGHSMGGMIVPEMVRLAPDRVGKLVLYGTGPQGVLPDRFETIAQSRARLLQDGVAATARRIAATWFRHGGQAGPLRCAMHLASGSAFRQRVQACKRGRVGMAAPTWKPLKVLRS